MEAEFDLSTPFHVRLLCALTLVLPFITFPLFAKNMKKVSDRYRLWVTPPPVFFSIWAVIISCYDLIAIYSLYPNSWSTTAWICFAVSNFCISGWVVVFSQGTKTAVNLGGLITVVLVFSNQTQWVELCSNKQQTMIDVITRNIFAFGQGWFIAAASLSLGIYMVYTVGLNLQLHRTFFWITTPVFFGMFLLANETRFPPFTNTLALLFSMVWALVGAGTTSVQPLNEVTP